MCQTLIRQWKACALPPIYDSHDPSDFIAAPVIIWWPVFQCKYNSSIVNWSPAFLIIRNELPPLPPIPVISQCAHIISVCIRFLWCVINDRKLRHLTPTYYLTLMWVFCSGVTRSGCSSRLELRVLFSAHASESHSRGHRSESPVSLLAIGQGPLWAARGWLQFTRVSTGISQHGYLLSPRIVRVHLLPPSPFWSAPLSHPATGPAALREEDHAECIHQGVGVWRGEVSIFCLPHPCMTLGSVFILIAGLMFKNRAVAGPGGGSQQEVEHGAPSVLGTDRRLGEMGHWPALIRAFSCFAEIVQGWIVSSQFRKG